MASTIGVQFAVDLPGMPPKQSFRRWVQAALAASSRTGSLAVRIVDEAESASLNSQWRGKHGPTNVLSFPMTPPADIPVAEFGDVIICAPVVAREASQQRKSLEAHFAHMVVHGVLHLLGHDHQQEHDALRMERLEAAILDQLGFADPYAGEGHV